MIEKLILNTTKGNLAESMDKQQRMDIVLAAIKDYDVDVESREKWLEINNQAMDIVHMSGDISADREYPFKDSAKVIYPLLSQSIVQASSMIIPHIIRGDKALFINFRLRVNGFPRLIPDASINRLCPGNYSATDCAEPRTNNIKGENIF